MHTYSVLVLCLFFFNVISVSDSRNNVCTSFRAYQNMQEETDCFYNPDLDSTPTNIAARYGYLLKQYSVTTKDGYIISIFRLIRNESPKKHGQPVILTHGIIVDGLSWIISGNNSLGFNLASNGFDLWIPHLRGSEFSSKHINSSISEKDYWNFSFHELGVYDLPAIIDKVVKTTNRKDVIFIGHSMGASSGLVYASLQPEHAQKYIKGFIHLAPVAFFKNLKGVTGALLPLYDILKDFLDNLNVQAVGNLHTIQSFIIRNICGNYPMIMVCEILYSSSTGLAVEQLRPEVFPFLLKLYPSATSIKTLDHYVQIIRSNGRFQWYDYGKEGNLKKYNATVPPRYDVKQIKIPTHIFASEQDYISEIEDTYNLHRNLSCPKNMQTYNLGHTDYMYGKNINSLYADIVHVMKTNFSNNDQIK